MGKIINEKKHYRNVIEKVLKLSPFKETEVFIFATTNTLTRFANNEIIQNISTDDISIRIRVIEDQKTVSTTINNYNEETIKNSFKFLKNTIKYQQKDERLFPLTANKEIINNKKFSDDLLNLEYNDLAEFAKKATEPLEKKEIKGFGISNLTDIHLFQATSNGFYGENRNIFFKFSLTAKKDGHFVREDYRGYDLNGFAPLAMAEKNIKNLELHKEVKEITAGKYDVIFSPQAFSELLRYLLYFSFSGLAYIENRTFLNENLGKKVFPESINLVDHPNNPDFPLFLFDAEGSETSYTILINKGECNELLTNKWLSKVLGRRNTGNAFNIPSQEVYPFHPVFLPGDKSVDDVLYETENGLYINRLHYINIIDPKKVQVTGMTRDGVYLIKNGSIVGATQNLRFTESVLTALQNIDAICNDLTTSDWFMGGSMETPSVKVKNFNFTSTTKF